VTTPQRQISRSSSTLHAYLQLVRLPNLFTAMADVVMGFLFTHAVFSPGDGWALGLLVGASTCLYAAGVVLNDVFDYEVDCRERPERPLPSGRVSLAAARWLGWELLVLGLAMAWLAGALANDFRPGVVATLLAGCIVSYDALLKGTPVGPLGMGACRALNVLLGMSLWWDEAGRPGLWNGEHWLVAASVGTYVAGVTWFARGEAGRSRRWPLAGATAVMMLGIGLLSRLPKWSEQVGEPFRERPDRWPLLIGVLAVLIGYRCVWAVIEPAAHRVQTAVRLCILSLVILDAAACLLVRGTTGAVIVLLLLVPTVALGRWIEST
jgi:hypothetical protein